VPATIQGRVVAITGGARGIGRAIAARLAGEGVRVAIGDVDLAAAELTAGQLPGDVLALEVDVSERASFEAFVDEVEERLGPLDVLVNNAGILLVGPFLEEDDRATEREFAVNVGGVMNGMRTALPRLRERGRGQVVNIASSASWLAPPGEVSYSATKHAVHALTDGVRKELRGSGVELTAVFPGLVDTELAAGTIPTRGAKLIGPDEVAEAVVDAIRDPRPEVFVPRQIGFLLRFHKALPEGARRRLDAWFAIERLTAGTSASSRAAYMERIGLARREGG
jgi:hypothetical protein